MELPASFYGKLDKRNPVVSGFENDVKSFVTLMRRAASSTSQDNDSHAKGIKILVDIWKKYKHRLPSKMYQERMLQIADFLFGIKLYQVALWQGYGLQLLHFSTVNITDVTDVDHFMACFFPEGFDADPDIVDMKIRAMQGCAICVFELEKRHSILSQKGLCKLLQVLNFLRIMMQALQQHEHLCWQIYNASLHIYTICRYLMTMNYSEQAFEYLLWASISLELSIPLMTAKYLPWIVTLYCAVCHCYFDQQAVVQAEEFARRALGKINEQAKLEEQSDVSATRETQSAYKEASIKLAAMIFKRAVFEGRKRFIFRVKAKSVLRDIPNGPWPRTMTERMLMGLFDNTAAQFLCILEALWDSNRRPLQTRIPDDPQQQEVILELLSAGISILSGVGSISTSLNAVTLTPTLIDLAIAGENKVSIISAVRFIKLLFQYKQTDAFTELTRDMLEVLSVVKGKTYRRAELELELLDSYNKLLCSQRSCAREDNMTNGKHKSAFLMTDEFIGLVDTLYKSVCGSIPEMQPNVDLVLDVVIFLWGKVKMVMQRDQLQNPDFTYHMEKVDNFGKWLWCLSVLCEVATVCDLAGADCMMTAEMIHTLALLLESAAENSHRRTSDTHNVAVKPRSFSHHESSSIELLKKLCEVVEWGLGALAKHVPALLPQDGSAIIDPAFMQKWNPLPPPTPNLYSPTPPEGDNELNEKKEVETKAESDITGFQHTQTTCVSLLATDLHLEFDIIHHRASLKLLQLNAVLESELLDRIKKNKVSKALYLIQKALLVQKNEGLNNSNNQTKSLLQEASTLIEKAGIEERKLYISTTYKNLSENKDNGMKKDEESPPPAPILVSRSDHSLTFVPGPYNLEGQVCFYQLCGRAAEGIDLKVRVGDCSLPGTGSLVPAVSGECLLRVEGLERNQKYVFAVAAYNKEGKLLGNTIGATTFPLLASVPVPLLSTWAHLAQAAFQTKQFAVAKRACRELWSHYTSTKPESHSTNERLATITRLCVQTLENSSPHLCQLFLTSIFIETEINIQQELLYRHSFTDSGPFIWEQEARLAECERMLVAADLAMWLNDGSTAVQTVVYCYDLLTPLIFHHIPCQPVVQVLKKCLIVLEENMGLLKEKWTGSASESFMHLIACITYYLSKSLRILKEEQMASVLMDYGRRLLQEIYDAQLHLRRPENKAAASKANQTTVKCEIKMIPQLKALHWKNKKRVTCKEASTPENEAIHPVTLCENPAILYDLITNSALKVAYKEVIKHRCKPYFLELASLLLQRTMEEGHTDLMLKWGKKILEFIFRRDEMVLTSSKRLEEKNRSKITSSAQQQGNEAPQNKIQPFHEDMRRVLWQNMPRTMRLKVRTNRDVQDLKRLLVTISSIVQRHKKLIQLRNLCYEERAWRSQLNYSLSKAHLVVLSQGFEQLHGGDLQHRYSQFSPLCFSLAYSGFLVWRSIQQQQPSKYEVVSERDEAKCLREYKATHKEKGQKEVHGVDESVTEDSSAEELDLAQPKEQQTEMQDHTAALLLESLDKAALHLRRAMVLAHRGSHWTLLQCVCHTVWDQSCRISVLAAQLELPCSITSDHLHNTFTSLLVLSTDLIMDMLSKLGLWSLYDSELTEEELELRPHFSATLDDSTLVDLRWVRTLVLNTLQHLHDSGKWERLVHFGLLFNSYTRERYALITIPLIIHAQRRLLERVHSFGGPPVPQPHHVKTQKATGKEVTCRNYADSQLLSGWTPQPTHQPSTSKDPAQKNTIHLDTADLKGAEIQHSMSLVCVPLDIEDTLSCYRLVLERRPHCLQVFQHSRELLLLLLANTQPCFAEQLHNAQTRSLSRSTSVVGFIPIVKPIPNIQPCDLMEEDYSTPTALYRFPISPDHMPTIIAAYSASIKYLQFNGLDPLRTLALHEMGNLQFYNGNTRAAHSYWNKAVDCALSCSGAVGKWDGASFEGDSMQQTLKQAGIWGCLHAAGLTAKIAQYILTSDISQRTKCCLLSAHLFMCVLCCSLAQPHAALHYAHHSIGEELVPGIDLFSEPHRVHLGTTITSLNFVCHWLYTTGSYITLLPIVSLYLHFVGTVCRDVQRTVEGKILKIRALIELCMFTEAVKESVELTKGAGIILPSGQYIAKGSTQPMKIFYSNKCLQDNAEALEELVSCDFAPDVQKLYGSVLCVRFNLARIQLILALCKTMHVHSASDSVEEEDFASTTNHAVNNHEQDRVDTEGSCLTTEEPEVLTLDTELEKLTPKSFKFFLLERASSLLNSISQQLTSQSCTEIENLELTIESKLLWANLYLQQGHSEFSSEVAVSSLVLLQTSPLIMRRCAPDSPATEVPNTQAGIEQAINDCTNDTLHEDCGRAVEASERVGVPLWLRCRLALIRSLTAEIPDTATLFPGKNKNEEAIRLLQEGIDECSLWGEVDIQALLMVEGAELEARRGKTDDSMGMLQEAISLLSGRTSMTPGSSLTLAQAIFSLSNLQGLQSTTLLKLAEELLKQQMSDFGQSVVFDDGLWRPTEPSNIYLPHLHLLNQITLKIGK